MGRETDTLSLDRAHAPAFNILMFIESERRKIYFHIMLVAQLKHIEFPNLWCIMGRDTDTQSLERAHILAFIKSEKKNGISILHVLFIAG